MGYAVGVDIGGTFTDFVLRDTDQAVNVFKVPTTPEDPSRAVIDGLRRFAEERETSLESVVSNIDIFVHGTTIATNTVIQRNGPKIGLICTEGHRDVLALRDGRKWEIFNLHMTPPDPFIPRYLRRGVRERIDYSGAVVTPLDEEHLVGILDDFREEGVESIAVALLWSIVNDEHERAVRDVIRRELPDAEVMISSEILPMIREWPRTSATALSAYIKPGISRYLTDLEEELSGLGLGHPLLIMQATGGTSTIPEIQRRPVFAMGSGPAAGPAAGSAAVASFGIEDFIAADMGGTSFDVAMVTGGRALTTQEVQVDYFPIGIQALEVHSIGAGGGSIIWIDAGGALRVGPRSAGSVPGPASYGRGGIEPTVTDANLVLGYLDESNALGGTLQLQRERAEEALETHVARALGQTVPEAAMAAYELVNSNMVEAIKTLSVQRGIDPRDYALVVGGGAGGIHGAVLGAELQIPRVVIPPEAGAFCAMGMIAADVRHDYLRTLPQRSNDWNPAAINALYEELEAEALEALRQEGVGENDVMLARYVDAKYQNQLHEITISVPSGRPLEDGDVDDIARTFHEQHRQLYTFAVEDAPLDFYHWRLAAFGKLVHDEQTPEPLGPEDASAASKGTRQACFSADGRFTEAGVYDGERLRPGMRVSGPAIIERTTTTIVIREGDVLSVNEVGAFSITRP